MHALNITIGHLFVQVNFIIDWYAYMYGSIHHFIHIRTYVVTYVYNYVILVIS